MGQEMGWCLSFKYIFIYLYYAKKPLKIVPSFPLSRPQGYETRAIALKIDLKLVMVVWDAFAQLNYEKI